MDLGVVDMITTDAIGEPGMRTFYLQARSGGDLVTVVVEKEQVVLLAQLVLETLADLPVETGAAANPPELEDPVEPLFRAGKLSIGYDPDEDRFLLEITEFEPEIEDEDEDEQDPRSALEGEPESVRLWASREQMLALSRRGAAVAELGRPTCRFCGNPMDPEGHVCPATNGHRAPRA